MVEFTWYAMLSISWKKAIFCSSRTTGNINYAKTRVMTYNYSKIWNSSWKSDYIKDMTMLFEHENDLVGIYDPYPDNQDTEEVYVVLRDPSLIEGCSSCDGKNNSSYTAYIVDTLPEIARMVYTDGGPIIEKLTDLNCIYIHTACGFGDINHFNFANINSVKHEYNNVQEQCTTLRGLSDDIIKYILPEYLCITDLAQYSKVSRLTSAALSDRIKKDEIMACIVRKNRVSIYEKSLYFETKCFVIDPFNVIYLLDDIEINYYHRDVIVFDAHKKEYDPTVIYESFIAPKKFAYWDKYDLGFIDHFMIDPSDNILLGYADTDDFKYKIIYVADCKYIYY